MYRRIMLLWTQKWSCGQTSYVHTPQVSGPGTYHPDGRTEILCHGGVREENHIAVLTDLTTCLVLVWATCTRKSQQVTTHTTNDHPVAQVGELPYLQTPMNSPVSMNFYQRKIPLKQVPSGWRLQEGNRSISFRPPEISWMRVKQRLAIGDWSNRGDWAKLFGGDWSNRGDWVKLFGGKS